MWGFLWNRSCSGHCFVTTLDAWVTRTLFTAINVMVTIKDRAGDFLEGLRHIFHGKLWFRPPSARVAFTTSKCLVRVTARVAGKKNGKSTSKNRKWSRSFLRERACCRHPGEHDLCTKTPESRTPSCFWSASLWFDLYKMNGYIWAMKKCSFWHTWYSRHKLDTTCDLNLPPGLF